MATSDLPAILRLSRETRHRIYLYAGLGYKYYYGETPPAVYDLGDPDGIEATKTEDERERGLRSFYGLLLSYRTIYTEASELLYSANCFIIRYGPRRSLAPLRALTPHSLASLTSLKIILNQASCHEQNPGHEGDGGCCNSLWKVVRLPPSSDGALHVLPACHECSHDLPLHGSSAPAEDLLEEWHTTAAYLAAHIVPGKLELALVCDLHHEEAELAKRVFDGLGLLPRLKDCHVRLCSTPEPRLQRLAREAVLRARGIIASPAPPAPESRANLRRSRLIDLPRELRLRILEYTDLVTPFKEIGELRPSIGCFCRRQHTAFSSRCRCWGPPTALFLVCRTLHADADPVFYSQNRFIVADSPHRSPYTPWDRHGYPHASFAASHFLRHVVPRRCLGHLRFLEPAFSPFTHQSRPGGEHPALRDWDETVAWAAGRLNLGVLTVGLVVAGAGEIPPQDGEGMTRAQGREVTATYTRILAPLRKWSVAPAAATADDDDGGGGGGALARFHAELVWPLRWSSWVVRVLKRRAEQFVMGERYKRVLAAAGEPRRSIWTWAHICY
ncbi:hypothetical protein VTK26DRAFT_2853 [Humicola hyalothermophila]